jgi:hypothetical protein
VEVYANVELTQVVTSPEHHLVPQATTVSFLLLMLHDAERIMPAFESVCRQVQVAACSITHGQVATLFPGMKSVASTARKAAGWCSGRYDRVFDLVRMTFVCASLEAVLATFEAMVDVADFHVVRVHDTLHPAADPSASGHRGLTVNVRLESGHIAECRLVLGAVDMETLIGYPHHRTSIAHLAEVGGGGGDGGSAGFIRDELESSGMLQVLRGATGPVGDAGAVLHGGFPESSLDDVANGHIASVDATGAELDREWLSGPVAIALTSRDCMLTSITFSHATGLDGAKLVLVLSESVLEQLGKSLRVLRIAGCGVTGIIPAGLWRLCHRLEVLDLARNRLEGAGFPHHGSIGCKASLRVLTLADNRLLGGELPAWLGHCRQLQLLTLSQTQIKGNLPQQLGRLTRLREFRFAGAALTSSLPRALGWLAALEVLDLSNGQLEGSIPPELGQCSNLRELKLGANQFSGNIPEELAECSRLRVLDLSDNLLQGGIPAVFGNSFPELRVLNLQQNQMVGSVNGVLLDVSNLCPWRGIIGEHEYTCVLR